MSLSAYAARCELFEAELLSLLSKTDVDALRKDVGRLGLQAWYEWYFGNARTIAAFLQATPSVRRNKKDWNKADLKRRLVLAALHRLGCARKVLENLSSRPLEPGCGYREMVDLAADFYMETFVMDKVPHWPFDDPNPFAG